MNTGLFPIRGTNSGQRPVQPVNDARVATLLSEGRSLDAIARKLDVSPSRVEASFKRICATLGDQAR